MATVIRLTRQGKKKKPFFRIVVQDSRSPRDGRFIEHIGHYEPLKDKDALVVRRERLEYWLGTGAKLSELLRTRLRGKLREWQIPMNPKPKKGEANKAETKS